MPRGPPRENLAEQVLTREEYNHLLDTCLVYTRRLRPEATFTSRYHFARLLVEYYARIGYLNHTYGFDLRIAGMTREQTAAVARGEPAPATSQTEPSNQGASVVRTCPTKLNQPVTQLKNGACFFGANIAAQK